MYSAILTGGHMSRRLSHSLVLDPKRPRSWCAAFVSRDVTDELLNAVGDETTHTPAALSAYWLIWAGN